MILWLLLRKWTLCLRSIHLRLRNNYWTDSCQRKIFIWQAIVRGHSVYSGWLFFGYSFEMSVWEPAIQDDLANTSSIFSLTGRMKERSNNVLIADSACKIVTFAR